MTSLLFRSSLLVSLSLLLVSCGGSSTGTINSATQSWWVQKQVTNISTGTGSARLVSTGSTSMTPPIDGTGSTSITGTGSASANDKEKAQQARSTEVGATIQSAIEKKDPSICRTKFEGMEWELEVCLSSIATNLAMTSGKAELCNEIKNTELQSKCMDNIIFGQAASKQDPKKCLEIKSSDFQGSCISALVSMNIKTPPTLESCSIANTPEAKSACEDFINLWTALTQKKSELCEKIVDPKRKSMCASGVEGQLKNGNTPTMFK